MEQVAWSQLLYVFVFTATRLEQIKALDDELSQLLYVFVFTATVLATVNTEDFTSVTITLRFRIHCDSACVSP